MTKPLMTILLACMIPAAVVFGQEQKPNDLQPELFPDTDLFLEHYEHVKVTDFFAPTRVCTKDDAPRPGSRFAYGPCVDNFRRLIPLNNSPAWDCEHAHGAGNCLLIQMQTDTAVVGQDSEGFPILKSKWVPDYVPKCKTDFRLYLIVDYTLSINTPDVGLFCGRIKQ